MAVRDSGKVGKSLLKKGFRREDGRHHVFYFFLENGQKTAVYTKISHGSAHDIHSLLLGKMARQCRLSKAEFLDLVDCPMSGSAYRKALRNNNHL